MYSRKAAAEFGDKEETKQSYDNDAADSKLEEDMTHLWTIPYFATLYLACFAVFTKAWLSCMMSIIKTLRSSTHYICNVIL